VKCRLDSSGSGQSLVAGTCKHDNESLCSIKGGVFVNKICLFRILRQGWVPWTVISERCNIVCCEITFL
jgi:hypothetical protein